MFIREFISKIKTEAIAPHGTPKNEFELMVAGAKPAAIVSPKHFKELYEPVADSHGWVYHQLRISGMPYNNYVVATSNETLSTIVGMLATMNKNLIKGIQPDDAYHRKLEKLLGYSDEDIEHYIVHNAQLKRQQNGH